MASAAHGEELKLLEAARKCDEQTITRIVSRSTVNLNVKGQGGCTAVHLCCKSANLLSLALLLERGAKTDIVDDRGLAPLHHAAMKGYRETMATLMAHGADVNIQNKIDGKTPLHYASKTAETVKFLLFCGADPNVKDKLSVWSNASVLHSLHSHPDSIPVSLCMLVMWTGAPFQSGREPAIAMTTQQKHDQLAILQAFKERKIHICGKMIGRNQRWSITEPIKFRLENTCNDPSPFLYFCRKILLEHVGNKLAVNSQLAHELDDVAADVISDVYEYIVSDTVEDITVTIPVYCRPSKYDNVCVLHSSGERFPGIFREDKDALTCTSTMRLTASGDKICGFAVVKEFRTDTIRTSPDQDRYSSSVQTGFELHVPAGSLSTKSVITLKVIPVNDYKHTLNTDEVCSVSNFYDTRVSNRPRKLLTLSIPLPDDVTLPHDDVNGKTDLVAFHSDTSTQTPTVWTQVECSIDEVNRVANVKDVSVNNGTSCLAQINIELMSNERQPDSTWLFTEFPDNRFLSDLSEMIGAEWLIVGVGLGLTFSFLERIERSDRPIKTMLFTWREENDQRADLGVTCLFHSLRWAGRNDLVQHVEQALCHVIKERTGERICTWLTGLRHSYDDIDGVTSGSRDEEERLGHLIEEETPTSPFTERFLLHVVDNLGLDEDLLLQMNVPLTAIQDARRASPNSSVIMLKCLVQSKRKFADVCVFYEKILQYLKLKKNNVASQMLRDEILKWLNFKHNSSEPDERINKLRQIAENA